MDLRSRYRQLSFSSQLILWFLLLGLLPVTAVALLSYRVAVRTVRQEVTSGLNAIAQRQSQAMEELFRRVERDVTTLARTPAVQGALAGRPAKPRGETPTLSPDVARFLRSYLESMGYPDVFLVMANGNVLFTANHPQLLGTVLHRKETPDSELAKTFDLTITLLSTETSDFWYDAALDEFDSFIGAPVFLDGTLVGVVILELSQQAIFDLVRNQVGLGETGETLVAFREGDSARFVTPWAHAETSGPQRVVLGSNVGIPMQESLRGHKGSGIALDYRGVPTYAVWRYLPFLRSGLVVKVDADEAFADVNRMRILFLLLPLAVAALVVGGGWLLSKSISQPIQELTAAAEHVAKGEFGGRITSRSNKEVSRLTSSFNTMSESLKQHIEHLDALVEVRTGELTQKNHELEEAMQKLQTAQQALVMQEKMASLGALTAGVAHEIKNPLNFVTNFAELSTELAAELREVVSGARDKLGPNADQDIGELLTDIEDNARKIKEHGGRANSIVDGMLLHSRGVPGERQPTDLNKLLDEYVDLAYHGMRAKDTRFNITIERHYDPAVGVIHVVPQDMSRVFLNLINNACYATDEKKKSSAEEFSPTVRVSTKNLEGAVEVRVRDNGRGIPAKSLDNVFQPFFTTKPAGEGTGLGLSISYDVVVGTHQGEMRVESKEGEFAEFIITIPRV